MPVADELPVAQVMLDLPPAHLDRPFDYAVPATLAESAVPGVRVSVRFAGQLADGWVVGRVASSEHPGTLMPLRRVVSDEVVLPARSRALVAAVAERWAGTFADVVRLALPPRHGRSEALAMAVGPGELHATVSASAWATTRGGGGLLDRLSTGESPRAAWTAPGGGGAPTPWDAIAQAAIATIVSGRQVVVVAPDARSVRRVREALDAAGLPRWDRGVPGGHAQLMADDGPAERYLAFLAGLRGSADVIVGTRAAAFAPVARPGLVVCWEDGDGSLRDQRSPYPHAREVVALRAGTDGCAVLFAGLGRSVEVQRMVEDGWLTPLRVDRADLRRRAPRVRALTSEDLGREGSTATARLPQAAWTVIKEGLSRGPVLVQVPRAGYLPVVACAQCREPARCQRCHGPITKPAAGAELQCGWCGALPGQWSCSSCGSHAIRAVSIGSGRTAEELGRAFPGVRVRSSGAGPGVIDTVGPGHDLVVATPGATPWCPTGYAAAAILDAAITVPPTRLDAATATLQRWIDAACQVVPASDGGVVVLVGDGPVAPTQALVRWDPEGLAQRELAERRELALPPCVRTAAVEGTRDAVTAVLGRLDPAVEVLGPVPVPVAETLEPQVRAIVRLPLPGTTLVKGLAASLVVRSARREGGTLRVTVDPAELL